MSRFEPLADNEVISTKKQLFSKLLYTFKAQELVNEYKNYFSNDELKEIFSEGIEVEVLKLGAKEWKKGKMRFSLEFCPDEPVEEILESNQLLTSNP